MLNITLCHPFWTAYPMAVELYKKTPKLSGWISRVKRLAEDLEANPASVPFSSSKTEATDIANDFRGGAFESFGEVFIKLMGRDIRIGIDKYEPMTENDYGVDGKGIGINGKLLTVQFKFRGEYDTILHGNKDHLHNFVNASLEMGVDINDSSNMVIITTADDVFYKDILIEWKNKVRVIAPVKSRGNFKMAKYVPNEVTSILCFKSLLDGNTIFWNDAVELISQ